MLLGLHDPFGGGRRLSWESEHMYSEHRFWEYILSDKEVIQCGLEILSITTVPYFLCGIMDLIPGALRGMGHSAVPMVLSVIGTVGTRVLWIYAFFPRHRSLYFLFISYPGSWIATIIMQAVCFWFVRKKGIRQLQARTNTD